jgi:hypothetical protein
MRASRLWLPLAVLAATVACESSNAPCSAPSGGTFTVTLAYARTASVAIYCSSDAGSEAAPDSGDSGADSSADSGTGDADAGTCSSHPHPLDGTTWTIAVNGSAATVTPQGAASWSCAAFGPQSSPSSGPDGSALPGTGCYLLVSCGTRSIGGGGSADVQLEILAQSATDTLVLVHDDSGGCCTDEYSGSWH